VLAALGRWFGGQLLQLVDTAFLIIPGVGR
jgi:hypothetical protein